MGPRLAFWMAVGREMLFCFKTSSITQVFITSPSSLLSTERSRVATDKEICKMLFIFIMQRRFFFPTEDQQQKLTPWLTHLYSLPSIRHQTVLQFWKQWQWKDKRKISWQGLWQEESDGRTFCFQLQACTSEENNIVGNWQKIPELLCPSKRHLGMAFSFSSSPLLVSSPRGHCNSRDCVRGLRRFWNQWSQSK